MAQLPMQNFDATQVKPGGQMDPVSPGVYKVVITESEMKPTSDGKGQRLNLVLEIIDGEFAKRKLFDNLNLVNDNAQAVEIAYGTLSAICHATGVMKLGDSSELHNKPLSAKVAIDNARTDAATGKTYDAQNKIKRYMPLEGGQQSGYVPPSTPAPSAPPAPPAGGTSTGWTPSAQTTQPPPATVDYGTAYPKEAHEWANANPNHEEAKKIIASRPKPPTPPAPASGGAPPWANQQPAPTASKPPWAK